MARDRSLVDLTNAENKITALMQAAFGGFEDIVKMLIDAKADIDRYMCMSVRT